MPRIPTHQFDDDWDDEDFDIDNDDLRDRQGRRINPKNNREDRDWEEQRREHWRKHRRNLDI